MQLEAPVLFIIFKRPDKTRQVFNIIRQVKPKKLYIAADGPRTPEEQKLVEQTRAEIKIDWDCQVTKIYHKKNVGIEQNPTSGITKMLSENPYGIILEDDILASPSFFYFAQELLEKYKDDSDIGMITGMNPFPKPKYKYSYFFTRFGFIYGWATWQRVWKEYDNTIQEWGKLEDKVSWLKSHVDNIFMRIHWYEFFNRVYQTRNYSWAYQLSFLMIKNNYKAIVPKVNLTKNIGMDDSATHKFSFIHSRFRKLTLNELEFPLKHPEDKKINLKLERKLLKNKILMSKLKLLGRPFKYWPLFLKLY